MSMFGNWFKWDPFDNKENRQLVETIQGLESDLEIFRRLYTENVGPDINPENMLVAFEFVIDQASRVPDLEASLSKETAIADHYRDLGLEHEEIVEAIEMYRLVLEEGHKAAIKGLGMRTYIHSLLKLDSEKRERKVLVQNTVKLIRSLDEAVDKDIGVYQENSSDQYFVSTSDLLSQISGQHISSFLASDYFKIESELRGAITGCLEKVSPLLDDDSQMHYFERLMGIHRLIEVANGLRIDTSETSERLNNYMSGCFNRECDVFFELVDTIHKKSTPRLISRTNEEYERLTQRLKTIQDTFGEDIIDRDLVQRVNGFTPLTPKEYLIDRRITVIEK